MQLFSPNHVKLLNSCYPPTALLTAGPDYSPNSHELSRLTYYAYETRHLKFSIDLVDRLSGQIILANSPKSGVNWTSA